MWLVIANMRLDEQVRNLIATTKTIEDRTVKDLYRVEEAVGIDSQESDHRAERESTIQHGCHRCRTSFWSDGLYFWFGWWTCARTAHCSLDSSNAFTRFWRGRSCGVCPYFDGWATDCHWCLGLDHLAESHWVWESIDLVGAVFLLWLGIDTWKTKEVQVTGGFFEDASGSLKLGIMTNLVNPASVLTG